MLRTWPQTPLQVLDFVARWLLPLVLVCLFLDSAWHHIHQEARSVITDGHYTRSVNFYHWIKTGDSHFLLRYGEPILLQEGLDPTRFPLHNPYPPLVYGVTSVVYAVVGPSLLAARLSLLAFAALLLGSSFLLGRRLAGHWGGMLVMSAVATSPLLLTFSRLYFLDFPRAALVVTSLFCLVMSAGFRSRGWSLSFGVLAGLSMLTGWTVPLFLALPTLWAILPAVGRSIQVALSGSKAPLLTLLLTLLWGGALLAGLRWSLQGCVSPTYWLDLLQWRIYLLWSVGIPTLGLLGGIALLKRPQTGNLAREQINTLAPELVTEVSPGRPLEHFALALAVAVLLFAPWYWYMLGDMRAHVQTNVAHAFPLTASSTLSYLSRLVMQGLWMGPVGVGVGLVGALFLRRDKGMDGGMDGGMAVILPLTGLVVLGALLQTGRPDHFFSGDVQVRITLPALPLIACAAAGWLGWIERLKRRWDASEHAAGTWASIVALLPVLLGLSAMGSASVAVAGWRIPEPIRAQLEPWFGSRASTYLRPPKRTTPDMGRSSFVALSQQLATLHPQTEGYGRVQVLLDPSLAHELGSERFYTHVLNTTHLQLWMQQASVQNMVPLAQALIRQRQSGQKSPVEWWLFLAPVPGEGTPQGGATPAGTSQPGLTSDALTALGMPIVWAGILEKELSVVILDAKAIRQ